MVKSVIVKGSTPAAIYNEAIVYRQSELKTWIGNYKSAAKTGRELALLVEYAAHALSCHPQRSIPGENARRTCLEGDRLKFSRHKRKQA